MHTQPTAVFLDLDGTLWEWGVVPDSAREAIRRAQANGHKILTNTGRARSEVPDLTYLALDGFCFAAGAEIILDGKVIVEEPMGVARARGVAAAFDALGLNYNIEAADQSWIMAHDEASYQAISRAWSSSDDVFANIPHASEMPEEAWERVLKLFYYPTPDVYEKALALMPAGITLTSMGHDIAEATRADVTKATAMEAVRAYLGDGWRTMACGDSDNDLTMLRAADVSAAMGNGNANAKATATWVTTNIDEDGLWNAFAHFGLI